MSIIATESFTGTNGILLTSRPCDTGQSWTKSTTDADSGAPGDFIIRNNRASVEATATADGATAILGVNPANANYSVIGTLFMDQAEGSTDTNYPTVEVRRSSTARTGYFARQEPGSLEWKLYRVVAGTFTLLATTSGLASIGAGTSLVVTLSAVAGAGGSVDLTLTVNPNSLGNITVTFNDSTSPITAIGNPAISIFGNNGSTIAKSWDLIQVDGTAAAGTANFHLTRRRNRR